MKNFTASQAEITAADQLNRAMSRLKDAVRKQQAASREHHAPRHRSKKTILRDRDLHDQMIYAGFATTWKQGGLSCK